MTKLELKKNYIFRIEKILKLDDNSEYFLLINPLGERNLMSTAYYADYHFTVGQEISARIDKINCQGRLFIEPEHPFFKISQTYLFNFLGKEKICKKNNKWINVLILLDELGEKQHLEAKDWQMSKSYLPEKLRCKVLGLKKSKLILEYIEELK